MQELFEMDWSFMLVLIAVSLLMLVLGVRSRILKRQRKRAEKRHAGRVYREWLASSHMQPLEMHGDHEAPGPGHR